MPMILIDSEVLGALVAAADDAVEYLGGLAADCDTDGDAVEAAEDYRERAESADAAVTIGRSLLASAAASPPTLLPEHAAAVEALAAEFRKEWTASLTKGAASQPLRVIEGAAKT